MENDSKTTTETSEVDAQADKQSADQPVDATPLETIKTQPEPQTLLPAETPEMHEAGHKPKLSALLVAAVAGLMLLIGLGAGFGVAQLAASKAEKPVALPAPQQTADKQLAVPEGATVIAECAKGRGKQYVLPENIPQGPVYNVYNGKVIGIEYMLGQQDVLNNKDYLNLPLRGVKYDHINIGLLSKGHSGYPDPHYHVDVFTISHEEAAKITCQ